MSLEGRQRIQRYEDAKKFVADHDGEFRPPLTQEGAALLDDIEGAQTAKEVQSEINALLDQFETKVLVFTNSEVAPHAKRILIEASTPAAYKVVNGLIQSMRHDIRVGGVVLFTDNIAGKQFMGQSEGNAPREMVRTENGSVLEDALLMGTFDVVFTMEDAINSPAALLMYSAKSVFGAKKSYHLLPGFPGETTKRRFSAAEIKNVDEIDGLIVGDELAGRIAAAELKISPEKILVAGSPLLDTLPSDGGVHFRNAGREKAGISEATATALFLGDRADDYKDMGGSPDLNIKTFQETVRGMITAATQHPEKQFALLVRPHPRATDEKLLSFMPSGGIPPNLQVIENPSVSFDEALYTADIICCPLTSTETFLARYRGREAAVFSYEGKGMSSEMTHAVLGQESLDTLASTDGITFLSTGDDLAKHIARVDPMRQPPALSHISDSTEKVKEVLLS